MQYRTQVGEGEGEDEGDIDVIITTYNKQDYLLYIAYRLLIDCPLIALDAHMCSHNGYGPGTKAQAPKAAGPQAPVQKLLGPGPWSRAHIQYGWAYVHHEQSIGKQ